MNREGYKRAIMTRINMEFYYIKLIVMTRKPRVSVFSLADQHETEDLQDVQVEFAFRPADMEDKQK
jgi:hypothetical protein